MMIEQSFLVSQMFYFAQLFILHTSPYVNPALVVTAMIELQESVSNMEGENTCK